MFSSLGIMPKNSVVASDRKQLDLRANPVSHSSVQLPLISLIIFTLCKITVMEIAIHLHCRLTTQGSPSMVAAAKELIACGCQSSSVSQSCN